MAYEFRNTIGLMGIGETDFKTMGLEASEEDRARIAKYSDYMDFFKGYHWEKIPPTGKREVTKNYCKAFVNKYVSFEFGKGFGFKMAPDIEPIVVPFLNEVWDINDKYALSTEYGLTKAIKGDVFVQVIYEPKYIEEKGRKIDNPNFYDPYNEYDKGRIKIIIVQPDICFPEYSDAHDKKLMTKMVVQYKVRDKGMFGNTKSVTYRQEWTRERVIETLAGREISNIPNKYGIVPFFHGKNLIKPGENWGMSDLEDLIPLNMELNMKSSDVSEIIDYHSAPTTLVFGAKIGQMEKGANRMLGGLPTDGRVENLELEGDLTASTNYIEDIKTSMHEIGGIPEGALGTKHSISNTSGVALQVTMLPLIEKIRQKRGLTEATFTDINKMIIKIGLEEGLLANTTTELDGEILSLDKWKKGDFYARDVYQSEVIFEDSLPKDKLVEIQAIQLEMKLGLEDRQGGMKRLGKKNIQGKLDRIDKDREEYPEIYGLPTEEEKEAMRAGIQIKKTSLTNRKERNIMKRSINENTDNKDAEINSGFNNSPQKRLETNSY